MKFSIYILRNSSGKLYIGQTKDIIARTHLHISKDPKAAKFTRDNDGFELIYSEEYATRLEAMRREAQIKKWSRAKKEALITGNKKLLKTLSKSRTLLKND